MSVRKSGYFNRFENEYTVMVALALPAHLPVILHDLIGREARKIGHGRDVARRQLARRFRIAPGTLENIERGRAKAVRSDHAAIIYGAEIAELEARLMELRAMGAHPMSPDFNHVQSLISEARKALGG